MIPRIIPETSILPAEDAAIRTALCLCFPAERQVFAHTRAWHGTGPTWSVLVEDEAIVTAHAGIVQREILIGSQRMLVAGVQNVLVLPEHRKTGMFRKVMAAAMEEAGRREIDLGLLFCTPDLAGKYARLGWRLLESRPVVRIDENGCRQSLPAKNVTMFYPLRCREVPPGDIHLLGNDW